MMPWQSLKPTPNSIAWPWAPDEALLPADTAIFTPLSSTLNCGEWTSGGDRRIFQERVG